MIYFSLSFVKISGRSFTPYCQYSVKDDAVSHLSRYQTIPFTVENQIRTTGALRAENPQSSQTRFGEPLAGSCRPKGRLREHALCLILCCFNFAIKIKLRNLLPSRRKASIHLPLGGRLFLSALPTSFDSFFFRK